MKAPFSTYNDGLFDQLDLFIVATADMLPAADPSPFGVSLRWHIDPTRRSSKTFLDILQRLDALTFGPTGMPMDKWVFYDCAELPGFIVGFAIEAAALTADERQRLGVPDTYNGPVPLSMYIAIPMREPGVWFGHNLASLGRQLPGRPLSHLGTLTKVMALKTMRAIRNVGVTQWASPALHIHTKFGALELLTVWTPVHSFPASLTYAFPIDDLTLRVAAGDKTLSVSRPAPTDLIETDDSTLIALQRDLESGRRLLLCGPPIMQSSESPGAEPRRLAPIRSLT